MTNVAGKEKIVVIVGPTAVGKSELAVRLAKKYNGEVVSADSRQVYKGLDIGTGKIIPKEMRGVPHHLLDVASPKRQFSVAEYQKLARKKLEEILAKGKLPIIVGGTGLYVQSIVDARVFPEVPPDFKLRKRLEKKRVGELFAILKKLDSARARTIDRHNPRRLIRAIEIARVLGKDPSQQSTAKSQERRTLQVGLMLPNEELRKRISIRLFARISEYMIEEVQRLHKKGVSWRRMEELGLEYRYISRYFKNQTSKSKMLQQLETEIWRYAKRQMMWFRRDKRIMWFKSSETGKINEKVENFLRT